MCPQKTLHVSLAWLLAVHASYRVPKDSLWERHAEEWMAELTRIAAESTPFRIAYEHVVATDSAVIAIAQPSEPVNRIREAIRERLRLSPETRKTRRTWCIPPCFAIAVRSLIRKSSLLCSRTRALTPQLRSRSWSSRES